MQFVSLQPFSEGQPIVELVANGTAYDLHNDGVLNMIEIDFQSRIVRLRWIVKTAAWKISSLANAAEPRTEASLSLEFSGMRSLRFHGEMFALPTEEYGSLDFLEYHSVKAGVGEARFVLETGSEIMVVASRCEALLTRRE